MATFIRADTLNREEIEAGIADGSLQYAATGPGGGQWIVALEPDDDPNEIHAGLPGGSITGVSSDAPVEWEFSDDK